MFFECEAGLRYSWYLEACLFLYLIGILYLVGIGGNRVNVAVFLVFGGRGVV